MRNLYSVAIVAVFFVMLLLPLAADTEKHPEKAASDTADSVTLLRDGKAVTLSAEEYTVGVVAAEMPALYEKEALKAQAVAAYTYAIRKRSSGGEITDKSALDQAYCDESERKEKWGSSFSDYESKIRTAVSEVCGQLILYDGSPIFAAYHAISSGHTESSANVWGGDYPYLCGVESIADKLSDGYKSELTLTAAQLAEKLELGDSEKSAEWITERQCSNNGTVLSFKIADKKFTGSEVREKLSLRSACFDIKYSDGSFTFTVYGYGHGVGMSQFGAEQMAKSGADYKEILLWYYPGCTVGKAK